MFTIKQFDQRPFFVVALMDDWDGETGTPVDLSTAGSAVFHMRRTGGGTAVKANGTCTIGTAAPYNEVTYQWAASDLDTVGAYEAEVEIWWGDGKNETFPSDGYWEVNVVDDIG